jgi:hypothetical protein
MMRVHVIKDGIVANTIIVDRVEDWPDLHLVSADHGGSIGHAYLGEVDGIPTFQAPPEAE